MFAITRIITNSVIYTQLKGVKQYCVLNNNHEGSHLNIQPNHSAGDVI